TCRSLNIGGDIIDAAIAGLDDYSRHPELSRFAWHWHKLIDRAGFGEVTLPPLTALPKVPGDPNRESSMFYFYVLLSRTPSLREFHRQRGVPEDVTLDTLSDLELWTRYYKSHTGRTGLHRPDWLQNHFTGRLYKLGRLQFESHISHLPFNVYQHR